VLLQNWISLFPAANLRQAIVIMTSERFFADLPSLTDFEAVLDSRNYHPLPDDWVIYIADVCNSTGALRHGLYRAVNMVGAACIVAVLNRCPGLALPYVFGGDGATLASPASLAPAIRPALQGVAAMAAKQFDLELRIGQVSVCELRAAGFTVEAAKYRAAGLVELAMLAGTGLPEAERRIKFPGSACLIPADEHAPDADVSGLSCRWEPLHSTQGEILTVLVQSRLAGAEADRYYQQFYFRLRELTGLTDEKLNPVKVSALKTSWPPKSLRIESRVHAGRGGWLARGWTTARTLAHSLGGAFVFKTGIPAPWFNPRRYQKASVPRSDFRKFDALLRMVLDIPAGKIPVILEWLAAEHRRGAIFYGVHRSGSALMTCVVFSLQQESHVHFVDGNDGGYALAALQFKQQVKSAGL
jgi:hypothetical protein